MNETPSIELIEAQNDVIPFQTSFLIEQDIASHYKDTDKLSHSNKQDSSCYQLVDNVEEFERLLREHEVAMYTKYTIFKTNGSFIGKGKDPESKPRVHWGALSKVSSTLATTPYLIVGTRYYVCHLGKCYHSKKLKGHLFSKEESRRKYKKLTASKKVGCPANFKVQRLILFPDNKLSSDTRSERARMGETIKRNIGSIRIEHKYLFKFPESHEHENHMEQHIAVVKEPIDKRVVRKVAELVTNGSTNSLLVMDILEEFVTNEIDVVDKGRRRFYPSRSDIQRLIYKAKIKLRRMKNDQEKVDAIVSSLGKPNEIYFQQSKCEGNISGLQYPPKGLEHMYRKYGFLFVYQNAEMRRLFTLYGHHCILLDPTYRFSKYSFPLYFVAVQTNVNYQIVAVFITEFEGREALVEALNVVANWNPTVFPKYAMADNVLDEIKALEIVYPEINVFISSYYCKYSWEQRLLRNDMVQLNRDKALEMFRSIADSVTEEKSQIAINNLKTEAALKDYFEKVWQKEIKKWALVYRPDDLIFESNEAVDRLHEEFRYSVLLKSKDLSLSEMIQCLCCAFIPESIEHYKTLNATILQRPSEKNFHIPFCLLQSPHWLLDIITEVTNAADHYLPFSYVEYLDDGIYSLSCKKTNSKFNIVFSPKHRKVNCSCLYFMKRKVICKHIVLVGRFYPSWNLEKICSWLFDNPVFKFDGFHTNTKKQDLTELNYKNSDINSKDDATYSLKKSCKQQLRYLETIINTIGLKELKEFQCGLSQFCEEWSPSRRSETRTCKTDKVVEKIENEIPFPILKRISDSYTTKEKKINLINKKRRKRKTQRLKNSKQFNNGKVDNLEMPSVQTYYGQNHDFNTLTVKIDATSEEDFELKQEMLVEDLDKEDDVVIQINSTDDGGLVNSPPT